MEISGIRKVLSETLKILVDYEKKEKGKMGSEKKELIALFDKAKEDYEMNELCGGNL